MEPQKTLNSQNGLEKEEQSWSQTTLQSCGNQNSRA